jgi:hypothetical protein
MVIGTISIALILAIIVMTMPHIDGAALRHSEIPFIDGRPFDSAAMALISGATLSAMFGHTSTANSASLVLRSDPTGRSLIRGCMAAMLTATSLYILWIVSVNGAIQSEDLRDVQGTAIAPLAEIVGREVSIAGALFAVLSMGMASILYAWNTKAIVTEWLPAPPTPQNRQVAARGRPRGRFSKDAMLAWISLLPLLTAFVAAEWLAATGSSSFSELIGIIGVLLTPIISGIFAMLMLTAARRKGECEVGYGWAWLGHPAIVLLIMGFFLATIVAHGLIFWTSPVERALALGVAGVLIAFVLLSFRSGAFTPGAVVHVRFDEMIGMMPVVELVEVGRPGAGRVLAADGAASRLSSSRESVIDIEMVTSQAKQLKIWVHQLTPEGISRVVRSAVTHNDRNPVDLAASGGKVILDIDAEEHAIRIVSEPERSLDGRAAGLGPG